MGLGQWHKNSSSPEPQNNLFLAFNIPSSIRKKSYSDHRTRFDNFTSSCTWRTLFLTDSLCVFFYLFSFMIFSSFCLYFTSQRHSWVEVLLPHLPGYLGKRQSTMTYDMAISQSGLSTVPRSSTWRMCYWHVGGELCMRGRTPVNLCKLVALKIIYRKCHILY